MPFVSPTGTSKERHELPFGPQRPEWLLLPNADVPPTRDATIKRSSKFVAARTSAASCEPTFHSEFQRPFPGDAEVAGGEMPRTRQRVT